MNITETERSNLMTSKLPDNLKQELLELAEKSASVGVMGWQVNKSLTVSERFKFGWKLFSFWAFLFNLIVYIYRGLWRKYLAVFGIYVLVITLPLIGLSMADIIDDQTLALLQNAGLIAWSTYFGIAYKVDLYRKYARKETFWL